MGTDGKPISWGEPEAGEIFQGKIKVKLAEIFLE